MAPAMTATKVYITEAFASFIFRVLGSHPYNPYEDGCPAMVAVAFRPLADAVALALYDRDGVPDLGHVTIDSFSAGSICGRRPSYTIAASCSVGGREDDRLFTEITVFLDEISPAAQEPRCVNVCARSKNPQVSSALENLDIGSILAADEPEDYCRAPSTSYADSFLTTTQNPCSS